MKADGQLASGTKLRSSKYLNNLIEQDHRGVKLRIGPMRSFKRFRTRGDHHCRHRAIAPDPKGPIQPRESMPSRQECARHLERGVGGVTNCKWPNSICLSQAELHQSRAKQARHQLRRKLRGEAPAHSGYVPQGRGNGFSNIRSAKSSMMGQSGR